MRNYILLFFCLLATFRLSAQLPTDFRSEQIFLSPEKHAYSPGDTVALEGQVVCLSAPYLLPYSNYLYVELCTERDSVLVRQKLSCKEKGFFSGRIGLDYLWQPGVYYLRAYTRLMCNFSPESFALQPLLVGEAFPARDGQIADLRCRMVPAGGKLVADYPQLVTVSLTDEQNLPVSTDLSLLTEAGDTIARSRTSLSGLSSVGFIPHSGVNYFLTCRAGGLDYRFPLPALSSGVKVQGSLNGSRLTYQILNDPQPSGKYRLHLYDRLRGLRELTEIRPQGIITLEGHPEAVSLFLTDEDCNILSEYTVVGKYRSSGSLLAPDTLSIGESLHYQLPNLPDSSRVMVRVVPEEDVLAPHAESSLRYLSDYASPLPFPSRMYASADDREKGDDLLAWLSSATFKRFSLKEAVSKDTALYVYLPEQVMGFGGRVEKKSNHPFRGGTVVAYHTASDRVYDASLDEEGRFYMAVDDFEEGDQFFLQAVTSKGKPDFADFRIADEVYPAVVNPNRFRLPRAYYSEAETTVGSGVSSSYNDGQWHLSLPDITVKARLRSEGPPKESNRFYQVNFADREKIEEWDYQTLYDIIRDMPGLEITRVVHEQDGNDGQTTDNMRPTTTMIRSTRGISSSSGDNIVPILIDGNRAVDTENALAMVAFEIESVELLRPWQTLKYLAGAINGAILVTTRNYKERSPLPSKGTMYMPKGLSVSETSDVRPWVAAEQGRYRLLVDVISATDIQSYEHVFEVR